MQMISAPARRSRRGTSLLEVSVAMGVLALLISTLYIAYDAVTSSSGEEAAKHTLRSVIAAQQLRYQSRGAFSEDPADLAGLEPAWTYIEGFSAAGDPHQVSVLVDRHDGADAVGLTTSNGTQCLGVVVYDPGVRSPITSAWESTEAPCTGDEAYEHVGVNPW